jgi:hypothetical protein
VDSDILRHPFVKMLLHRSGYPQGREFRVCRPELLASRCTPPSAQQVEEQHHDRNDQQDVYQAPGYMEAEAEKPQD